jgi:putative phosphoesterase
MTEVRKMKIAILSDTHGLLRPEVAELLKTADVILHGGDINKQSIVDELRKYAPIYIVRGNNDKGWARAMPMTSRLAWGRDLYHGP